MNARRSGWLGVVLVVLGLAMFLIAMFTGLNEYPEGRFPWWLEVAQWFGAVLVLAGLLVGVAFRFGQRRAT